MDIETQAHLKAVRELLEYRLRDLRSEVAAEEAARRGDALSGVADQKDQAARRAQGDVDQSQEQRDLREVAAIERALQRLDRGEYGDCLRCGQPIPIKRLMVVPAAELCVNCQHAQEGRAGATAG